MYLKSNEKNKLILQRLLKTDVDKNSCISLSKSSHRCHWSTSYRLINYINLFYCSERLFTFSKDQVQVILFRECDFRGRKLLFDSHAVRKVPLQVANTETSTQVSPDKKVPDVQEKYAETSNGYGYLVGITYNP